MLNDSANQRKNRSPVLRQKRRKNIAITAEAMAIAPVRMSFMSHLLVDQAVQQQQHRDQRRNQPRRQQVEVREHDLVQQQEKVVRGNRNEGPAAPEQQAVP